MNLKNTIVISKAFGKGKVINQIEGYIEVAFENRNSKFVYPDAFEKFIRAEDATIQQAIIDEINAAKKAEEEKKAAEAQRKIEEAERIAVLEQQKFKTSSKKKVAVTRPIRSEGKPMIFYVFQGNTFDKESHGGYIWAPITNKSGSKIHHWDRLLDVRAGDIILHGCNARVAAISTAKESCYECEQPEELRREDLWDLQGRRVDCNYIIIDKPIATAAYKSEIIEKSAAKYSPFDRDGNGNMGYLYEINRDLARLFVSESAKLNPYLLDYSFIKEFIDEK